MQLTPLARVLVSKLVFCCGSDIRKIFLFHIKRICAYCNDPINGGGFEIPTRMCRQCHLTFVAYLLEKAIHE
ncbi:hypothetical protein FBQ27_13390 [Escherichia coli]|nr:hypothetical protein [Escherichia coli]